MESKGRKQKRLNEKARNRKSAGCYFAIAIEKEGKRPTNSIVAAVLQQLTANQSSSEQRENIDGNQIYDQFYGNWRQFHQYYLSRIINDELRKIAVRTIFHEKIQGEAQDAVINIPESNNWELIKQQLKLRYRPKIKPSKFIVKLQV